ncbi:Integral membrane protein OS=Streptomyces microflavus OX=1919 GN=Smic_46820 PE=4 SV=1 [Streptomyces microflavus]
MRSVLLVLLGLLELGIAAAFLHSAATGSLGPDTVIAGVAVVVSGCVAAGCVPGPAATQPLTTQHTPHGRPTARTTG